MTMLDPKGRKAAIEAANEITIDGAPVPDYVDAIIRAYISTATPADVALPERFVEDYADGYDFRGDSGDYTPTTAERAMLIDFGHGLLGEIEGSCRLIPTGDYAGAGG